tara:strand:- start:27460 stop:28578 length:1119 start_codon:yes stop_codon:yes gene_type:complete
MTSRDAIIAVDARPLCHPGTGIYRYTRELLLRMTGLGGTWYLYSAQPYDTTGLKAVNIHHRSADVPSVVRASQMAHLFFPQWAKRDKATVFWGPRHQLPLYLPSSVRQVVTIHDLVWQRYGHTMRFPGRQMEAFFMPRALREADAVVAVSQFTETEIHTLYPGLAKKIEVVPGASHLADSGKSQSGRLPPERDTGFLFVGTLEPRKNLPLLLRAYARYREQTPHPLPLTIAGGRGWGQVDLDRHLSELHLKNCVRVPGTVSETKLAQLYRSARALVMPSLYEGFGLPVVEALSQGVPVVVSAASAMSEVAGDAGLFVDPLNERQMAEALLSLGHDDDVHLRLRNAAANESKRYDWERSAGKMFEILTRQANA